MTTRKLAVIGASTGVMIPRRCWRACGRRFAASTYHAARAFVPLAPAEPDEVENSEFPGANVTLDRARDGNPFAKRKSSLVGVSPAMVADEGDNAVAKDARENS